MLWGIELNLKNTHWLQNVVFEYLYTKYQSGPIYHDHTMNIPDHIAGTDNYYNHGIYNGWQHWGSSNRQSPFRSPIYNTDGRIYVKDNRFIAYHLGFDWRPGKTIGIPSFGYVSERLGYLSGAFYKGASQCEFLGGIAV